MLTSGVAPIKGRPSRPPLFVERGFTLIELIVVMILMAILAAVAAPKFFTAGDVEGPAFAQEVASAARYAQKLAITGGCPVRLIVTSATHYELKQGQSAPGAACDTVFTRDVLHPGSGEAFKADAPSLVTFAGIATFPLTLQFAATGAPSLSGAVFSVGGRALVVNARSGYVEVQ